MILKRVFATLGAIGVLAGMVLFGQRGGPGVAGAQVTVAPQATPDKGSPPKSGGRSMFIENLPKKFEFPDDEVGNLLLHEYGSVFLARNGVVAPNKVIFRDESEVRKFQDSVEAATKDIAGIRIELQKAAITDLGDAVAEAAKSGLSISPRGADSGKRDYEQTRRLWASRVGPGFSYWVSKGRVSRSEAVRIQKLPAFQQVPEILKLERSGIWFAKSLDKSIIYSVAPPGTSQHLSMLAFDVAEFNNPKVRAILANHGWFQTVLSDLPHFTYIGVAEDKLPQLGLMRKEAMGRAFWVPDL